MGPLSSVSLVPSQWFEKKHQGTALGVCGVGNVGAAVTNFGAPLLVLASGWKQTAQIYAVVLAVTAILFYVLARPDPAEVARKKKGLKTVSTADQLASLKNLQVWRFASISGSGSPPRTHPWSFHEQGLS